MSDMVTTVRVTLPISEQRIRDLMCSAWEGGSAYWCQFRSSTITPEQKEDHKCRYHWEYPFVEGVDVVLCDSTCEADETCPEPWVLNRAKIVAGIQTMAEKCPYHFANFLAENDDAETGDVFLQCCLFGDIIFG